METSTCMAGPDLVIHVAAGEQEILVLLCNNKSVDCLYGERTHVCVVNDMCNGSDDSHVVLGVIDTLKSYKIPLPNSLPGDDPT